MVKVAKIYLSPSYKSDENGGSTIKHGDGSDATYKEICGVLWDLQREIRTIKNRTVSDLWEWCGFSADYKEKHDDYPVAADVLSSKKGQPCKTIETYIYGKHIDECCNISTASLSDTIRSVTAKFKDEQRSILKGDKSILVYKNNQPIPLKKTQIKLSYDEESKCFYVTLALLSRRGMKKYDMKQLCFRAIVKDNSTRAIIERVYDGVYDMAGSLLVYDKKKKMFRLNLCYENKNAKDWVDSDVVLGVKISIEHPITAIATNKTKPFVVEGGVVEDFRRTVENRKISRSHQRAVCADGSRGHGYNKRMEAVNVVGDKIARFRDTYNHGVSRGLVEYAEKMNCGIIQLENLENIARDNPFLKNWSYYDLQTKIKYKAKEKGIKVLVIDRKNLNERCYKCGCVSSANIVGDNDFKCVACGNETTIDYNSAKNLSVRDVDKAIKYELVLGQRCHKCGEISKKNVGENGKFECVKCHYEGSFVNNRQKNIETPKIENTINKYIKNKAGNTAEDNETT